MTINVSSRHLAYYVACAVQIAALLFDVVMATLAIWRRDWGAAQWHLGFAIVASCCLYALIWARDRNEIRRAIDCEDLRGHTAQATVAETMLRHMNEASQVEIGISADDATARKH